MTTRRASARWVTDPDALPISPRRDPVRGLFTKRGYTMTINQALSEADELVENNVSSAQKLRWLARLDQRIKTEIFERYEGEPEHDYEINEDTPGSRVLAVPDPYSELYPLYIQQQIYYQLGEQERYNNAGIRLEECIDEFRAYWNRTHKHKQPVFRYWR